MHVIHDLLVLFGGLALGDFVLHFDASGDLGLDVLISLGASSDDLLFDSSSLDFLN